MGVNTRLIFWHCVFYWDGKRKHEVAERHMFTRKETLTRMYCTPLKEMCTINENSRLYWNWNYLQSRHLRLYFSVFECILRFMLFSVSSIIFINIRKERKTKIIMKTKNRSRWISSILFWFIVIVEPKRRVYIYI